MGESRVGSDAPKPHQEVCNGPWSRSPTQTRSRVPSSCLGRLALAAQKGVGGKCTNALMNGMCVLQEAKLAALASKRWEHQLKEQRVQIKASEASGSWLICGVLE